MPSYEELGKRLLAMRDEWMAAVKIIETHHGRDSPAAKAYHEAIGDVDVLLHEHGFKGNP